MVHVMKLGTFGRLLVEALGQGRLAIAPSQETRIWQKWVCHKTLVLLY